MSEWDNAAAMLHRAAAANKEGNRELAYQLYVRASELSPQDARAWQGRAETSTLPDEALVSYAYALALDPTNAPLARTLDAALTQRLETAKPADVPLLVAIGQELAEVGLVTKAEAVFARALELDPHSTDALVWLAGLTADRDKALDYLHAALAQNPNDARARAGIEALVLQSRAGESGDLHEQTRRLLSEGDKALARGDRSSAYRYFVRATELAPGDEAAWLRRAQASSDEDEQIQCYERVIAINPANLQAREARTMLRVRKLRQAAQQIEPIPGRGTGAKAAPLRSRERPARPGDAPLRLLLILLLLLAVLFLALGILLMQAR